MSATTGASAPVRSEPSHERAWRPEIQALRAAAVGAVLLFHLWPWHVGGGYVGVDVFFVISGFLITSHIASEVAATGTLRLGRFWTRRARRLLPASFAVLAATIVGTVVLAPASLWSPFLKEVAASALYVENWFLAGRAVDYLAADAAASPVQHYWSLSVEEQFYVVVPLLLLAAAWVARRAGASWRTGWLVALGVLVAGSLAWSVVQTADAPGPAYFSTLTRAWEFGLGALLAVTISRWGRLGVAPRLALAVAGWGAIAASVMAFGAATPFPSYTALLPTLGTAAVIISGAAPGLSRLYSWRPVQWLGASSYSAYLWHWPLIVLAPFVFEDLGTVHLVALLALTLVLAGLSRRFIEDRWRLRGEVARATMRRTAVGVGAAMVVVVGVCAAAIAVGQDEAPQYEPGTPQAECLGAPSVLDATSADCAGVVYEDLVPARTAIETDIPPVYEDCRTSPTDPELRFCDYGDPHGDVHVLLVGDSHAAQWTPAIMELARDRGWKLSVAFKAACPWTAGAELLAADERVESCLQWNESLDSALADTDADLVLTSATRTYNFVNASGEDAAAADVTDGFARAWETVTAQDIPLVVIADSPQMDDDTLLCVAQSAGPDPDCARDRGAATTPRDAITRAATDTGTPLIDATDVLCTETCDAVIGAAVVYRDTSSHMTATFAQTMAPFMARELEPYLSGLDGR